MAEVVITNFAPTLSYFEKILAFVQQLWRYLATVFKVVQCFGRWFSSSKAAANPHLNWPTLSLVELIQQQASTATV